MYIADTPYLYRKYKSEKGFTDAHICEISGMSTSTLNNIKKEGNIPGGESVDKLCKALGMTVSEFYRDTEEMVLSFDEQSFIINLRGLNKDQFNRLLGYMECIIMMQTPIVK